MIIAGFGRYGQIVGRMLFANGIPATVLDHDADTVESLRRFGWRGFWGDSNSLFASIFNSSFYSHSYGWPRY